MKKVLRLKARGAAMQPHFEAHGAGQRRYVGRSFDPSLGHAYLDENKNRLLTGGWPALAEGESFEFDSVTQPDANEHFYLYVAAVKDGSLWPADDETAQLCGVKWDPTFSGEFDAPKEIEAPRPTLLVASKSTSKSAE